MTSTNDMIKMSIVKEGQKLNALERYTIIKTIEIFLLPVKCHLLHCAFPQMLASGSII